MQRSDGRAPDALRPITIQPDFTEMPMASVLFKAGRTIVLCTASVEEDVPRWMKRPGEEPRGWITAEYAMLPGSTKPRARRERRSVGGRTQEIQRLIGRSLRAVVDLQKLGQRTITIDCEILQADGGTRTASISGGFVALATAIGKLADKGLITENPLKASVAAISCGIVEDHALLDLPYVEDSAAQVDMNVIMTGSQQLVEVQGTGEESTYSRAQLNALLDLAEKGVAEITALQREALSDFKVFGDDFWG
jgi:ribonuclease PH